MAKADDEVTGSTPSSEKNRKGKSGAKLNSKKESVDVAEKELQAISNWENSKSIKISDVVSDMKRVFQENRDFFKGYYALNGFVLKDSISDDFEYNVELYILKLNKIRSNYFEEMYEEWGQTRTKLASAMQSIRTISKISLLHIDIALEKAGHPEIEDNILEALRSAMLFARQQRQKFLRPRVRGPEPISYLIELLVHDLEYSLKRRLPRTFETNEESSIFDNCLAQLVFALSRCVDPEVEAKKVRNVLKKLSTR